MGELRTDWIVGWKNIITESYVGDSHGYSCDDTSVGTTNGAGGRNVQLIMISPDGVVVHALAGFWHPDDLMNELRFARTRLLPLWQDASLSLEEKRARFSALQQEECASHSKLTRLRSSWQGFDAKNEQKRFEELGARDTVLMGDDGQPVRSKKGEVRLKTVDVLIHDRIAARPFVPFAEFDVMAFADYGRTYYDNNKKVDGEGETFMTPTRVAKAEAKAEKKRQAEARREAKRARRAEQRAQQAAQRRKRDEEREVQELVRELEWMLGAPVER